MWHQVQAVLYQYVEPDVVSTLLMKTFSNYTFLIWDNQNKTNTHESIHETEIRKQKK